MSDIKRSSSADYFHPSELSSSNEGNSPRPASAPARLNGSSVSLKFTESKKGSIKIPTPFELAQEEKAYSKYEEALSRQGTEKTSLWSSLFGSKSQKDIEKSLAALAQFDHEDFHLDQAIKESKKEFCAQIAAAGGNPDIAEEVFKSAAEVRDLPSAPLHHKTEASIKPLRCSDHDDVSVEENDDEGPWKDVASVNGDVATESNDEDNVPRSIKEFTTSLNNLSRKEITSFLESLPDSEIENLASANLDKELVTALVAVKDISSLRGQLIDLCCSISRTAQQITSLEDPQAQQAIMDSFLEEPALIQNQGLYNSGVDCYLSSALQCLRSHVNNLPLAKREELLTSLRTRYLENLSPEQRASPLAAFGSPLVAFLEKKFDGRNKFAAAFLRQEVHSIMERLTQSEVNPSAAAREMANSINPITGNSRQQCDTSEALVALMEHLETPRVLLEERDTYHTTGEVRPSDNQQARQYGGELMIPFGIEKESSLQEVIHSNWIADLTGANAVEDPNGSKHDIRRERALVNPPNSITISLSRFRMKPDPEGGWAQNSQGKEIVGVPKLALDDFGDPIREKLHTPISHLTDNVTFPTRDHEGTQTETTYAPCSIICHYGGESANSGHYATFRKENDEWLLVNDAQVTQIHLDDLMADGSDMTYRNFLEQNAYVVNFRRVD